MRRIEWEKGTRQHRHGEKRKEIEMASKNIDMLSIRASSFQTVLVKIDNQTKKKHVSKQMAENFNRLFDDVKKEMSTDDVGHLPQPNTFVGDAARVAGMSDVYYVDLEIMIDTVVGILDRLKSEK